MARIRVANLILCEKCLAPGGAGPDGVLTVVGPLDRVTLPRPGTPVRMDALAVIHGPPRTGVLVKLGIEGPDGGLFEHGTGGTVEFSAETGVAYPRWTFEPHVFDLGRHHVVLYEVEPDGREREVARARLVVARD